MALLAALLPCEAQRKIFMGRSELMIMGGGMFYIGDLNDMSALSMPRLAGGIGLRYNLNNRWAFRVEGSYGQIGVDKDCIERRNLSFKSDLIEAAALAEFNFAPYGGGATEKKWTPFIFGGLALYHFNPMASYIDGEGNEMWVDLQPLCTEGQGSPSYPDRKMYPLTQVSLPFGVGIKVRLGKSFSLSAEYGFRKTWTDYLDDVSTTYVALETLQEVSEDPTMSARMADRSGEVEAGYVNAPGIKRGDDSLNDMYSYVHFTMGISLETVFGWMRSKKCRN